MRNLTTVCALAAAAYASFTVAPVSAQALREKALPNLPAGGAEVTDVQMLVPGFAVRALPVELRNVNAVRYRDDGKLVAMTFDGRVYLLTDTDGDGLEDKADLFYDPGRLHLSLNLALTPPGYPAGRGVFIARKGNLALQLDTDGDDRADKEVIVSDRWENPRRFPGGASDTIGVALDAEGNVYFGLGAANSQNGYLLENGVAAYRIESERGAILKMPPDFSRREVVATGIRAAFGLAFNAAGDLFATDQEGATWMPNGNPFDELLHIQQGRHYGFPPRHPRHLPNVIDEPSVFDYGPQHQSTCGLFFNDPVLGGPIFGPAWWRSDAFVAGEARGKLYRTKLVKTPSGYVGQNQIIAAVGWLLIDQCVSPAGDLVLTVHSGPPDWGTGALGMGRLFKLTRVEPDAAQPVLVYAAKPDELHVAFDRPIPVGVETDLAARIGLTSGPYVREGDRFETFRPGYRAVKEQQNAPLNRRAVRAASVSADRHTLIVHAAPQTLAMPTAIDIDDWPRARAVAANERPQRSVLSVATDGTGVEAEWRAADGSDRWSGWLPHFDLQVARELTAASPTHDRLWALLLRPGTLTLRGQLDLWSMLRPAVQPGERLDFSLPSERVTVTFAGSASAPRVQVAVSGNGMTVSTEGNVTRISRITPRERSWMPVSVTLPTGGPTNGLHVSWSTIEDGRARALPLHRVTLPWAEPPPPAQAPRVPKELAGGNWERGKQLFVMCSMCHGLNSEGSRVGPDLSNLVHRDYASVVMDLADPNAAINPDHVAYEFTLKSGEVRTAVLLEDHPDHVLLAVPASTPEKLPKSEIVATKASPVSLMPPAMDQALGPDGLRDLLTYLMLPPPADAQPSQP